MFGKIDKLNLLSHKVEVNKSNFLNEFLWTCAGVNKDIIRQSPNEYSKYAGVGGTILFTGLMAMISGGYAMFFVFNSTLVSCLFAIFWGLLIFNLDRFIVNSMYVDKSPFLTWSKLKAAIPRFIMAIFLGLVISTPLEMKIFNDKIESQLITDNINRVSNTKDLSQDYDLLESLQEKQKELMSLRNALNKQLQEAQKELRLEAEGNALSGKAGHGPIYEDKEKYMLLCLQALNDWDKLNQPNLNIIQTRIETASSNIQNLETVVNLSYDDGFIARYEAFSNVKSGNTTLSMMSFMITLLFIIIEIIPTFFKLVMEHGLYDDLCESYDLIQKTINASKKEEINGIIEDIKKSLKSLLVKQEENHKQELFMEQLRYFISKMKDELKNTKLEMSEKSQLLENKLSEIEYKELELAKVKQQLEESEANNKKLEAANLILNRKANPSNKKKKFIKRHR